MDLSLEGLAQAQIEWRAWRTICHELERLEIDLNSDDRLAVAIQLWGEELSQLRMRQSEDVNDRALAEKRARFAEVGLELVER